MASRRNYNNRRTRDTFIASPRLRSSINKRPAYKFPVLTRYQDFRKFFPRRIDNVSRNIDTTRSRIALASVRTFSPHKYKPVRSSVFSFSSPSRVIICIRRKIRKEVLHALKKSGKSGQRNPRRTAYSNIRCGG